MTRRIVCAANVYPCGTRVLGVRHFDSLMQETIDKFAAAGFTLRSSDATQGFVDNAGQFVGRVKALEIAKAAGQILYVVGGGRKKLYSETLY